MTLKPIDLTRVELNWLYRQLLSGLDKTQGVINSYSGPLSEDRTKELVQAQAHFEELQRLCNSIKDRLDLGDKERLQVNDLKAELEEALELAPASKEEILKRLSELPTDIIYKIAFDRETLKFTQKLVEKDLQKFRLHVIPNYENAEPDTFKDPIQTKEYWVNKARKSKGILEQLFHKLEKAL